MISGRCLCLLWIVLSTVNSQLILPTLAPPEDKMLHIGLLIPLDNPDIDRETGFARSAGSIPIAVDDIRRDHFLDDYNFTFHVMHDECDEAKAAGYAVELITEKKVHAILGPTCSAAAISAGLVASFYNVPIIFWGMVTASVLSEKERFPTASNVVTDSLELAKAFAEVMKAYKWDRFAFIYMISSRGKCKFLRDDLNTVLDHVENSDLTNTYSKRLDNSSGSYVRQVLDAARDKARIFAVCFDVDDDRRNFFLEVNAMKMDSVDFVYIMLDTRAYGFGQRVLKVEAMDKTSVQGVAPFWIDQSDKPDGKDQDALKAARRALSLDFDPTTTAGDVAGFQLRLVKKIEGWPFYYKLPENQNMTASVYARYLYDAMYLYAVELNRTLAKDTNLIRNGSAIAKNYADFPGASGEVMFNSRGLRDPLIILKALNDSDYPVKYASVRYNKNMNATFYPDYSDDRSTIWKTRGGYRPLAVPVCGFDGTRCPVDPMKSPLVIAGIIAGILLFIFAVLSVIYVIWAKKKEEERLNELWKIPYRELQKHEPKKTGSQSSRSLQSGVLSISTKLTIETQSESEYFALYYHDREPVVAAKHHVRIALSRNEHREMRKLRALDHSNVNKFLGFSVDAPIYMSIWKYCSRGSLQDIFQRESITMDSFFMYSLMRDILHGLSYIHKSFLEYHGNLTSDTCLVDDRWQVKISDYGLHRVRMAERLPAKKLLWTAPELLRDDTIPGTKAGDVYSFAIICSEIMSRKPAYDLDTRAESDEEIIYLVKRGGSLLCRPTITNIMDFNPAFIHLIRDCWSESIKERPAVDQIIKLMKSIVPGSNVNLMDHVFRMLESYADSLEQEVEVRTKELESEKKKSDLLLYRMMPKQIAEKLKMGASVEPESFESVTVFFSDVVSFTTLASRCTPLQVVDLLNRLYTTFDQIIDEHDVYKVETIGDGYLCVSGLPHRNGDRHIKEIADMSLGFITSLRTFRIPHIPSETVQIRVGVHTGSVVAGVVGLTMPRYCLFGDTVNTASRMESNSKPNQIHLSAEANRAIQRFPEYSTESRGDVIIKARKLFL